MSNKTGIERIDSIKRSERTPLLESAGMSESLINRSIRLPAEPIPTGVSWGVAAFLLVNTALGAGMLNYPYAYNQIGGILAAALMQIVSFSPYSLKKIAYCDILLILLVLLLKLTKRNFNILRNYEPNL